METTETCIKCGGEIKEVEGDFIFDDDHVGSIEISGEKYQKCIKCGDIGFYSDTYNVLINARNEKLAGIAQNSMNNFYKM